jgi:hypothetical protein
MKLKRISYAKICEWIVDSWDAVQTSTILKGFEIMKGDVENTILEDISVVKNNFDESLEINISVEIKELLKNFCAFYDDDFEGFE